MVRHKMTGRIVVVLEALRYQADRRCKVLVWCDTSGSLRPAAPTRTPGRHTVGKVHAQKIESKHINLRTWIKRLVCRTMRFSKTEHMHDLVIGLFINRYEFGRLI
jgi:IS1 family transposase